jgi:capsular polysaccharide transport system permease protein
MPTLLAVAYYSTLAADRFISESKFVVRSPAGGLPGQIAAVMQASGSTRSTDDSYIVHSFITSRASMSELMSKLPLMEMLRRSSTDYLWRYPGFFKHTEERLYKHLKSFVHLSFDPTSGISSLSVQAFLPDDARRIAEVLLQSAENLINELSERGQQDTLRNAAGIVKESRKAAFAALTRLTAFRTQNSVIDPSRVSASVQEIVAKLVFERAKVSAELTVALDRSPNSPNVNMLRYRITALDEQILEERKALAGSDSSLAPLIAKYERLRLEREFAEKGFASALTSFEVARSDSRRQQLYLERISGPSIPDRPARPWRIINILLTLAGSFAVYSICSQWLENTRMHDSR